MATITRSSTASMDASTGMFARNVSGLLAGEAIAVGQACYVKSDGKAWLSNGTSANAAAKFRGLATTAAAAGQPVTLIGAGSRWKYGSGLTPGAEYFVSATAGSLDDAATTGGTVAVAYAIDATDIMVIG